LRQLLSHPVTSWALLRGDLIGLLLLHHLTRVATGGGQQRKSSCRHSCGDDEKAGIHIQPFFSSRSNIGHFSTQH